MTNHRRGPETKCRTMKLEIKRHKRPVTRTSCRRTKVASTQHVSNAFLVSTNHTNVHMTTKHERDKEAVCQNVGAPAEAAVALIQLGEYVVYDTSTREPINGGCCRWEWNTEATVQTS